VRLAVVSAVDGLMATGPPAAMVADVVAPGVRPLAADHAPQVGRHTLGRGAQAEQGHGLVAEGGGGGGGYSRWHGAEMYCS
jgi:hypothetical protein